jgi:translation initiation factor 2 subunit 1
MHVFLVHFHPHPPFRRSPLQAAVTDPDKILDSLTLSPIEKAETLAHIKIKLLSKELRIRADVKLACVHFAGVEAIREALLAAHACGSEKIPIRVQLIAPPIYVLVTTTVDKAGGIAALEAGIEAAKAIMDKHEGQLQVIKAPGVTNDHEERELQRQLKLQEDMNAEVSGDDEDEDGDDKDEDDEEDEDEEGDPADAEAGASAVAASASGGGEASSSSGSAKKGGK